jgi:hypothetical protein
VYRTRTGDHNQPIARTSKDLPGRFIWLAWWRSPR